ncbi:hypothetical protein [Hazenella coriacea]|nr:hypothetical protein [Hazenella coriacea]
MDANVSLEALEKFKKSLTQFSKDMSEEAQKTKLLLKKVHNQLENKHLEFRRKLQMTQDPVLYHRAKQQLDEFERLYFMFCEVANECIKGFNHQELMVGNREKTVVNINRKVEVLAQYLSIVSTKNGMDNHLSKEEFTTKATNNTIKRDELLNAVSNKKLKNTINEMYRRGATTGDGGLADAIRVETRYGVLVGGKSHIKKGLERVRNLENIMRNEKLSESDWKHANELINDLKRALNGK